MWVMIRIQTGGIMVRDMADVERLIECGEHFCIMPWTHLHVTTLGNMNLCCVASEESQTAGYGNLNEHSFMELWQGEDIRKLRLRFLNDEADPRCAGCYEQARLGRWNLRSIMNDLYARKYREWVAGTDVSGCAPDAKPIYWDIRFSNVCNLRCRSCYHGSSSSWFEEAKTLGFCDVHPEKAVGAITGVTDPEGLLRELEPYLPFLERIHFAGGEPLLMAENYRILEKLKALGKYDLELFYTTNLKQLRYQHYDILSIWPKFQKLVIAVSLDGLGPKCEYLRKGLRWPEALANLNAIKQQCPDAYVYVNYTVSAFNVLHLADFHREMVENQWFSPEQIQLIFLATPYYYNMKILPLEMKKKASAGLQEHIQWLRRQKSKPVNDPVGMLKYRFFSTQWQCCIDYLNEDDWTNRIPEFVKYTDALDGLRHENCRAVFPELEPIYAQNKIADHWMPIITATF
jgi:sulfatase maturation enzyme AslB (radical SAM superfamily)